MPLLPSGAGGGEDPADAHPGDGSPPAAWPSQWPPPAWETCVAGRRSRFSYGSESVLLEKPGQPPSGRMLPSASALGSSASGARLINFRFLFRRITRGADIP